MEWLSAAILQLADLGRWAPLTFMVLYAAATIALAPVFVLALAAGALFGLVRGTVFAFIGALLGASAVHAMGARLTRYRIFKRLERDARVAAVRRAVLGDAVRIMFLLRLSPLVPFVLLNYALAFSGVRYRDFAVAMLGMLPTIVMYVYYGKVAGDVARLTAGVAPPRGPEYYALMAIGLVATVMVTRSITTAAKRAMDQNRRQDG
jgi:uncharacterized membrane protein YdjX (TVP38/TMEM64 family)